MSATGTLRTFPLGFPWETPDPFLFCAYHSDRYPAGNDEQGPAASLSGRSLGNDFTVKDGWRMYHGRTVPGFPAHPHCGFETVTLVTRGYCDHSDSLGAAARFGRGDAQWITTGRGLQHAEMFPLLRQDAGNTLELFQIWLNLPARSKRVNPHFRMLWEDEIPVVDTRGARIRLVAGTVADYSAPRPAPDSWAADPANDVIIAQIDLEPQRSWTLPMASADVRRMLYHFEGGGLQIGDTNLPPDYGVEADSAEYAIRAGESGARLLWLQGRPIGEPVAQYGPFVMNTHAEIEQAMQEFRTTQFGGWPWRHPDPVHGPEPVRFARFPDGTEIRKAASKPG